MNLLLYWFITILNRKINLCLISGWSQTCTHPWIAYLYLHTYSKPYKCVLLTGFAGCPAQMRGDRGNENSSIAACQMFFRHQHDDRYAGSNSFIFGSSIKNTVCAYFQSYICVMKYWCQQRIESLLSRLRSFNVHWWIDLFKVLDY